MPFKVYTNYCMSENFVLNLLTNFNIDYCITEDLLLNLLNKFTATIAQVKITSGFINLIYKNYF